MRHNSAIRHVLASSSEVWPSRLSRRGAGVGLTVGEKIPSVELAAIRNGQVENVNSSDLLGKGKVVLFAVPGAFTPTCSDYHLPGFVIRSEDLLAKGVDLIACISVNDPFVMTAWAASQGIDDQVVMLADGNGDFTKAANLELDGRGFGIGLRSQRYAAILEDGIVKSIDIEPGGGLTVSSAESVLAKL
ncbi:MAG: peroxiredoxin [Acidimicrobiaceae bacterium]|nr:peroxiredoxin [Acidimicrobiaceae bacterium]